MGKLDAAIFVVAVLGLVAVGLWWQYVMWDECREMGHSILYCIKVLSR